MREGKSIRSSGEAPKIPAAYSKATDVRDDFHKCCFGPLRMLIYGNMMTSFGFCRCY